ncbi:GTP-binding protein [Maribacter algarum]|uniref:GTP-binding protein n=1 Tax=Maribacter algarum (ex Zhang et al. 2020) TaxID=2578118 RepID=A0A5S3PVP9_9FLAO|nr:Rab family GTPase [Maribacter algarum]TMM59069.1 GTP-binding protein [Maribacter algarum]
MHSSKKIVVLGHFGVGKTSLIRRFVTDTFSDNYKVTIGVHITKKLVEIAVDREVSLILWDLEGTDEIESIRDSYLLGTHGLVFVFDVSRPSTFEHLGNDLKIVRNKVPETPLMVVGNKSDLVDKAELKTVLDENELSADFLTSAKTGEFVNELFLKLATLLVGDA